MGPSVPVPTGSAWTMAPVWLCPHQHPHRMVCSHRSPGPPHGPGHSYLQPRIPFSPAQPPWPVLPTAPRPGTWNLQCFNGGSCFLNARRQPKCRCQPRYTGDKCELDQCWEHCQNGGTCAASPSGMPSSSLNRTTPAPGPQPPTPPAPPLASLSPDPALLPPGLPSHLPPTAQCPIPLLPPSHPGLEALLLCSKGGWFNGSQACSHILSHQACPRAAAPQASQAQNAPSRCVRAIAPTTAPALSTRATSPSADACLASWVTAASTVSQPFLGPGEGRGEPRVVATRVSSREGGHS